MPSHDQGAIMKIKAFISRQIDRVCGIAARLILRAIGALTVVVVRLEFPVFDGQWLGFRYIAWGRNHVHRPVQQQDAASVSIH